ncbi:MAG: asparagine synthase B [Thermoleophilaceae bacterium]
MCGIVGEYGGPSPDEGRRMLDRITHRGPDDKGEAQVGDGWLGHTRLSIVDVQTGHQPLGTEDDRVWLVGNGEVYNHEHVRDGLDRDTPYATKSDNEVALHLVREKGPHALDELEGMFAFLIAGQDGFFLAARDPVGIKPLYWAESDGVYRFASEMHSFEPDWRPFVEVFPPGHFWTPDGGLERFADAVPRDRAHEHPDAEPSDADLDETREELIGAVHRQMMGDVPVGVFLSGGLDSTLIAAIAARYLEERGQQLKTFAVGTESSSDLAAARLAAEHLNTDHHEHVYTAEEAESVVADVVRSIEHFDPSLVRSAVPNYLLAKMTAEHVKVVLTGEGADELFAGYEYLSELEGAEQLHDEIVRTVEGLHNLNLQRADRVTMAHGLEARVPFLDREVIALALRLPAQWKLAPPGTQEKMLLRRSFEGWLPDELLYRDKEQFGDGSGAADVLTHTLEDTVSDDDFEAERDRVSPPFRTKEELAYFRIWSQHLEGIRPEVTLARFATA